MNVEEVDKILADFRAWLLATDELPLAEPAATLDVATVVQQFTALRQEVNLQTRASRAQLEQNAEALTALQQAVEGFQQPQEDDVGNEADESDALRPLLKTLIDAHDALSLAFSEVRRLMDNAPPMETPPPSAAPGTPPSVEICLPYWARWLGLDAVVEAQIAPLRAWRPTLPPPRTDESAQRFRQALDAMLVGYRMSMQRIERALEQYGLEAIDCVGQPFDPEIMEVAEVVRDEGRTSTEVLQVIRRGYRRRGKLFRYAQVRVAKP